MIFDQSNFGNCLEYILNGRLSVGYEEWSEIKQANLYPDDREL